MGLFSLQHHGTHRVAFMFAPIATVWLLCLTGIGAYNIFRWNSDIYRALSPIYMFKFLRSTGVEGWVSLGGVVLAITGNSCTCPIWIFVIYLLLERATGTGFACPRCGGDVC